MRTVFTRDSESKMAPIRFHAASEYVLFVRESPPAFAVLQDHMGETMVSPLGFERWASFGFAWRAEEAGDEFVTLRQRAVRA